MIFDCYKLKLSVSKNWQLFSNFNTGQFWSQKQLKTNWAHFFEHKERPQFANIWQSLVKYSSQFCWLTQTLFSQFCQVAPWKSQVSCDSPLILPMEARCVWLWLSISTSSASLTFFCNVCWQSSTTLLTVSFRQPKLWNTCNEVATWLWFCLKEKTKPFNLSTSYQWFLSGNPGCEILVMKLSLDWFCLKEKRKRKQKIIQFVNTLSTVGPWHLAPCVLSLFAPLISQRNTGISEFHVTCWVDKIWQLDGSWPNSLALVASNSVWGCYFFNLKKEKKKSPILSMVSQFLKNIIAPSGRIGGRLPFGHVTLWSVSTVEDYSVSTVKRQPQF